MYNRYIPQPDGSFRRSRIVTEETNAQEMDSVESNETATENQSAHSSKSTQRWNQRPRKEIRTQYKQNPSPASVGSFLKNLLPPNFDTEDLIVVLLLLLMSGSTDSDQNAAMLTLGIYLFL